LMLRVARAYFDVLQAQDNLAFIQSQKIAITEQRASARRRFDLGTATIVDIHEAQAQFDQAHAQEITAQNEIALRLRTLQNVTGIPTTAPARLLTTTQPALIETLTLEEWLRRAADNNPKVLTQALVKQIAENYDKASLLDPVGYNIQAFGCACFISRFDV